MISILKQETPKQLTDQERVKLCQAIFKRHSNTYYYSSYLFPKAIRGQVYILYAFVRLADEYVDNPTSGQDPKASLEVFQTFFEQAWAGKELVEDTEDAIVVNTFVELAKKVGFEKGWVDAFFASMAMDVDTSRYQSEAALATYIFGSADVIGLMMSKIMGVPEEGLVYAQALGTSFQRINFLRDIGEDREDRGRIYLALDLLDQYKITAEEWMETKDPDERYKQLLEHEIRDIQMIDARAAKGIQYIPKECRAAVELARFSYNQTLALIAKHPRVVFQKKLRTSKLGILMHFILLPLQVGRDK